MTLAFAVSIAADWDEPHWAAFAVAFCSLATGGESLLKGALRIFGTFLGGAVALTLIGLFPQDRWLFPFLVSVWIGFCTWKMTGTSRWYFWFVAGFTVPLLSMLSAAEKTDPFDVAVLRGQQTLLGIIVFTLVSSFVFPSSSRQRLIATLREQVDALHSVFEELMADLRATPDTKNDARQAADIRTAAFHRQSGLLANLDAAVLDSFTVSDARRAWRAAITALADLLDELERFRLGIPELKEADAEQRLSGLEEYSAEIRKRLKAAAALMAGEDAEPTARDSGLAIEDSPNERMALFQRAALNLAHSRLKEIDRASRDLLFAAAAVRGLPVVQQGSDAHASDPPSSSATWQPDPERLAGVARAMTAFWLAYLTYVYIPDVPSWVALISLSTTLGMLLSVLPALPISSLILPGLLAIVVGGAMHILVMPHLSGFLGLGTMIFLVSFVICWIWHTPSTAIGRSFSLAFFATLIQISNPQVYSFTFVANFAVAFLIPLGVLTIASALPVSFKPARVIQRLLDRYFVSAVALLETLHKDARHENSWWTRQKRQYHTNQIIRIPGRLSIWVRALPDDALGREGRQSMLDVCESLDALSNRLRDLTALRSTRYDEEWITVMLPDVRPWRLAIQNVLEQLSDAPEEIVTAKLQQSLSARLQRLEDVVDKAIAQGVEDRVGLEQSTNLYRELGAFRGVSEALVAVVARSEKLDWPRFREARFY